MKKSETKGGIMEDFDDNEDEDFDDNEDEDEDVFDLDDFEDLEYEEMPFGIYEPELAQSLGGNPHLKYNGYWAEIGLKWLLQSMQIAFEVDDDVEPEFVSELFDFRPYYWGDDKEESEKPNFHYKKTGLKICWYKYVGRGMSSNAEYISDSWIDIIQACVRGCIIASESDDTEIS